MKTHISLGTRNIDASITFYRTLLGVEPAKHYADYALFLPDDPGLELALTPDQNAGASGDTHFGIAVDSQDFLRATIERLRSAGLAEDVEIGETCCYAVQDKVWATDPDGRRWETYYVIAESDERNGSTMACCADLAEASCC